MVDLTDAKPAKGESVKTGKRVVVQDGASIPAPAKKKSYPRLVIDKANGGAAEVQTHDWDSLRQEFGVLTDDAADGLLRQIINAKAGKTIVENDANFAIGAVRGIGPADTVEALLAAQMVAVHLATMAAAQRLGSSETIGQHEANLSAFNKLSRTFAAQVEALKRYRSKGEQRVYVERVNVESGAQAIVGAVNQGGRG